MGFHNHHYPRPLVPNPLDPSAVDFRAFYPYTPNEVKHRKRTTTHQLKVLESVFKRDTKPNAQLRQDLAVELNMTARGVQVWFQNRRAKEKARLGRVSSFANDADDAATTKDDNDDDSTVVIKSELVPNESALVDPACEHSKHRLNASLSPASPSHLPLTHLPSPPQLRVITDTSGCDWDALRSPVEHPPPDSAVSAEITAVPPDIFYSLRRGSLPITTAFADQHLSADSELLDPLVRRRSVDASLQRLGSHPYASLARAKNSALYGAGVGVMPHNNNTVATKEHNYRTNRVQCLPNRLQQRRFVSSSALSTTTAAAAAAHYGASLPPHAAYVRRLSMDSRASRLSQMQRTYYSPSPSPLSSYGATVRASLPEPHFYSLANRSIASPLPGPLPQPGFQFGAASSTPSIASPSSAGSERNSPDSLKSFVFGGEEEPSPRYDAYSSRFGSVASIATSESSVHSVYYGSTVDHMERRDSSSSCTTPYMGVSHEVDVINHPVEYVRNCPSVAKVDPRMGMATGVVVGYSPPEEYASYQGTEANPPVYSIAHHLQQKQQDDEPEHSQAYVSPIPPSTVTGGDVPISHAQDPPPPALLISSTSELAFALKSENSEITISTASTGHSSTQEAYATRYGANEHSVGQIHVEQRQLFEHQPATYYGTDVQQLYQEHQSAYASAYPYANDAPPPSEYGMFSSTGDYPDSMASSHIMMNQAFVTYS